MPAAPSALTDPALAAVTDARDWARQAEVAQLVAVLDWAGAHEVDGLVVTTPGLRLGGPGCPVVSEFDAWDLACVLGRSPDSCLRYLGNALELRHRLPKLWQRVLDLEVPLWHAFRITARTQHLPAQGAADVDRALAHCAERITLAQVERSIAKAFAEHLPAEAEALRETANDARHFDIGLRDIGLRDTDPLTGGLSGVVEVRGLLDHADALDLDAAVSRTAAQLADLGSTESADARRATALGEIARAQLTLDLSTGEVETASGRAVTIVAHVDGTDLAGVALVDGTQTPVLVTQLLEWCTRAGTKVTIKPVIDLAADLTSDGYAPSTEVAEQVDLRDRRCVFPYCTRRRTDRDHRRSHRTGGPTASHNLARLCRGHHRAKTFSHWTYDMPTPGVYVWHSPAGATYLVDRANEP